MRPGAGTISAQVWEIARSLSRPGNPAARKDVVACAVDLGIHDKTASTQFGAWKRHEHPERDGVRRVLAHRQEPAALKDRHWGSLLKNGFNYGAD
jgi:hypothetical protein